jgi:hypothetical protein
VCRPVGGGPRSVLAPPQSRHVGAFKELSDWNLFTPKQRLSHRGHPVHGVVRSIVPRAFSRAGGTIGSVVLVAGDVRLKDIEERENLLPDALLD